MNRSFLLIFQFYFIAQPFVAHQIVVIFRTVIALLIKGIPQRPHIGIPAAMFNDTAFRIAEQRLIAKSEAKRA